MLNPRQKKFAELYHRYGNATRAYGEAYDAPKTETGSYPNWVSADGNRLVRNEKVKALLAEFRGETQELASMTLTQTVDYLVSAVSTPIEDIGPDSPLCEEYTVSYDKDGGKNIKTKSVSKIAALKELIRLTGMAAPKKVEVSAGEDVKEMLRRLTGAKKEE